MLAPNLTATTVSMSPGEPIIIEHDDGSKIQTVQTRSVDLLKQILTVLS